MRVVIAGYYGYRNWGDEGSLAALLRGLDIPVQATVARTFLSVPRSLDESVQATAFDSSSCLDKNVQATASDSSPRLDRDVQATAFDSSSCLDKNVQATVLSGDPAFTEATYGVSAIPRMDLRSVRQAIRHSDALILGGGSLLQDATSLRSLIYYLALIRWGLRAHGRVLLIGQGVGPLMRPISRWLVRTTLRRVPFVSVRDADSASLLQRLGVAHATLDADLTWSLTPLPPHVAIDAESRWIGVAPRRWRDAPVQQAFTALCRQLHADGYRTLLIPMQESQDRALCEAIAAETDAEVLPPPMHPAQLLGIMQHLHGMIAMRLHGAIFAASQGMPVLCVSYDPKVDALAKQIGALCVGLERIEQSLIPAWQAFQAQRNALRQRMQERTAALRDSATALLQRVASECLKG